MSKKEKGHLVWYHLTTSQCKLTSYRIGVKTARLGVDYRPETTLKELECSS